MRRSWQAYALLAPIFILLLIFNYYPPILGLLRAFYRWRPGVEASFVGLQHFGVYFTSPETPRELFNMFKLLAFFFFSGAVIPFIMAVLIFRIRDTESKELYRLFLIIPMLVPLIVVILLWKQIYDPNLGVINGLLEQFGLGFLARNWLGDTSSALYAIMFMGFPWVSGVGTLIYLGGLGQISESIFDACEVDGCTGLRRTLQIDPAPRPGPGTPHDHPRRHRRRYLLPTNTRPDRRRPRLRHHGARPHHVPQGLPHPAIRLRRLHRHGPFRHHLFRNARSQPHSPSRG